MSWVAPLRILLFAAAVGLIAYLAPNNYTMSDSRGALLTAQSMLEGHDGRLDAYPGAVQSLGYRLTRDESATRYFFPVGSSLLALPAVAIGRAFDADMVLDATDTLYQMILGSLVLGALVILFWIPLRRYGWRGELVAVLLVVSGPLMSTVGTAYWNLGPAMVCVVAGVLAAVAAHERRSRALTLLVPVLFALAWLSRPTSIVPAGLVVVALLLGRRVPARVLLVASAASAASALAIQYWAQGQLLPPYYRAGRVGGLPDIAALTGLLVSPSRGLLVFAPHTLALGIAAVAAARTRRDVTIVACAIFWFLGHLIAVSRFEHWWGGHSFGPRLMTEGYVALALAACLVDVRRIGPALRRPLGIGFTVLAAAAVWIHVGQGLYEPGTAVWNSRPVSVDVDPARIWAWDDCQILANRRHMLHAWYLTRKDGLQELVPGRSADADSPAIALEGFLWPYQFGDTPFAMAVGRRAALEFRPADAPTDANVDLVAELRMGAHHAQRLTILAQGENLLTVDLRGFEPATLSVVLPRPEGGTPGASVRRLDFRSEPLYTVARHVPSWRDPKLGISFWSLEIDWIEPR